MVWVFQRILTEKYLKLFLLFSNMGEHKMKSRVLKEAGLSFTERTLAFLIEHPEYRGFTAHILGTYVTCKGKEANLDDLEVDEAYEHIYGNSMSKGCKWCQEYIERLIRRQKEFYR